MRPLSPSLAFVLCGSLFLAGAAFSQEPAPPVDVSAPTAAAAPDQAAQQSSDQDLQLVAPITLYPDALVAQILAASTYPVEVVEAWRWLQQHTALKGESLATAVNSQQWDPSVKALTQFPSVLDNLNENLSWTSALGDAYVNAPDEVMNAVQVLRQRAQTAGELETTSEQVVTTQDQTIAIAPTNPDLVYVPAYDPWLVYGSPLAAYPGWVPVSGAFFGGPDLYFGAGFDLGVFAAFDWGWQDWGFDWHRHAMLYHHSPYFSHSPTFAFRHGSPAARSSFDQHAHGSFDHAGLNRPGASLGHAPFDHPGGPAEDLPSTRAGDFRGSGPSATTSFPRPSQSHDESSFRPGAFSGFDHGGTVAAYSARGRSSFNAPARMGSFASRGMGGASHAFAGGSHGGGGHR